jgi:hypothetical protein
MRVILQDLSYGLARLRNRHPRSPHGDLTLALGIVPANHHLSAAIRVAEQPLPLGPVPLHRRGIVVVRDPDSRQTTNSRPGGRTITQLRNSLDYQGRATFFSEEVIGGTGRRTFSTTDRRKGWSSSKAG